MVNSEGRSHRPLPPSSRIGSQSLQHAPSHPHPLPAHPPARLQLSLIFLATLSLALALSLPLVTADIASVSAVPAAPSTSTCSAQDRSNCASDHLLLQSNAIVLNRVLSVSSSAEANAARKSAGAEVQATPASPASPHSSPVSPASPAAAASSSSSQAGPAAAAASLSLPQSQSQAQSGRSPIPTGQSGGQSGGQTGQALQTGPGASQTSYASSGLSASPYTRALQSSVAEAAAASAASLAAVGATSSSKSRRTGSARHGAKSKVGEAAGSPPAESQQYASANVSESPYGENVNVTLSLLSLEEPDQHSSYASANSSESPYGSATIDANATNASVDALVLAARAAEPVQSYSSNFSESPYGDSVVSTNSTHLMELGVAYQEPGGESYGSSNVSESPYGPNVNVSVSGPSLAQTLKLEEEENPSQGESQSESEADSYASSNVSESPYMQSIISNESASTDLLEEVPSSGGDLENVSSNATAASYAASVDSSRLALDERIGSKSDKEDSSTSPSSRPGRHATANVANVASAPGSRAGKKAATATATATRSASNAKVSLSHAAVSRRGGRDHILLAEIGEVTRAKDPAVEGADVAAGESMATIAREAPVWPEEVGAPETKLAEKRGSPALILSEVSDRAAQEAKEQIHEWMHEKVEAGFPSVYILIVVAILAMVGGALAAVKFRSSNPLPHQDSRGAPLEHSPATPHWEAFGERSQPLGLHSSRSNHHGSAQSSRSHWEASCTSVGKGASQDAAPSTPRDTTHAPCLLTGRVPSSSTKPAKTSSTLCKCLVVPAGMELNFAVQEVVTSERQRASFSIVDMKGSPLSHIVIDEAGCPCGISMQLLDKTPLAFIRTSSIHERAGGMPEICWPSGQPFCVLARSTSSKLQAHGDKLCSGLLFDVLGTEGQVLFFAHGDVHAKAMNIINAGGHAVCTTERCSVNFDSSESYYQVRVAPCVDAGLMLCILLAIDKLSDSGS